MNRAHVFDELAKQQFLSPMRRYEAFGRLKICGFCLMDNNHYLILLEAAGRPAERPSEQYLISHVEATLGKTVANQYRWRLYLFREGAAAVVARQAKLAEDEAEAAADWIPTHEQVEFDNILADIWRRMHDLSCFVQSLKRQFTYQLE